jgi:hypothetical protein
LDLPKKICSPLIGTQKLSSIFVVQSFLTPLRPAHFVALDHKEKCVVVAIRGSIAVDDWLTDLIATNAEFEGGYAHLGITRTGMYLTEKLSPIVKEQLQVQTKLNAANPC